MVVLPLPLEQCQAVVESLRLPYPLYADPHGDVYRAFDTDHILYAPKQGWIGIDEAGAVRYRWRQGAGGEMVKVPFGLDALEGFEAAL